MGIEGDGFCFVRCIPARCAPTPFLRKEGGMDILPRLQRPRYARSLRPSCRRGETKNGRAYGATVRGAPVPDQKLLRPTCSTMRAKPSVAKVWASPVFAANVPCQRCGVSVECPRMAKCA